MFRLLIAPIALLAAACSPPASQEPATSDADMNMEAAAPDAAGPITSTGTVTQIDAAAGAITINHGAIEAVSWPAMTMRFTAENPVILQGLAVGDRVRFELKSAAENTVVVVVTKE